LRIQLSNSPPSRRQQYLPATRKGAWREGRSPCMTPRSRRMFRALPGDRAFLPPSPALLSANLTPASGRQDHTSSPSASHAVRYRRIRVHRIPPRGRDDRVSPLCGTGPNRNTPVSTEPSSDISEIQKSIENPWVWRIGSTRCCEPRRNGTAVKRRPDLPVGQPVKPGDAERQRRSSGTDRGIARSRSSM
jgi:hypothetical protein